MGFFRALRDILEAQDWGWFNAIRDALIWLLGESEKRIEDAVEWVLDNLDKLTRFFGELWDRALKVLTDLYWGLRAWVDTWWNQLTRFFLYDLPRIWGKLWDLVETVSSWASGIISQISCFLSSVWPVFSRYVSDSIGLLFDLWDLARKSIENLTQKINEVSNDFQNFLQTTWQTFTTNTTSLLNSLSQAVFGAVIPSLQAAWEILEKIPSAVLGILNQPEKLREEEEGIREASLTHMKGIIQGKTPIEIQPPPELSKALHSSPIGILELLFFYLIQVLGFNLFGLYRWVSEFPGLQRDRDELPDAREMSLEELMSSVDYVLGSIEDLIAGIVERIVVVHPDGSTSPIPEAEMRDPEVVAETPFGVPGLMYVLYTTRPHGLYIVLSPYVGGYKCIYDEEKNAWKIEWASAEECRRLMDKAGFKIVSFGVA
ncbi:MAG: hypothetical protein J7L17_04505 [Thaumarchaeota archaeon]|nr:hypothetical protein [Nitrososphaerota archaeon]